MARQGRKDRGLLQLKDRPGWYVRINHFGKPRQFGPFSLKTEARLFYERSKAQQREGRFDPDSFRYRAIPTIGELIATHLKNQRGKKSFRDDQRYARVWSSLAGTMRPADLSRSVLLDFKEQLRTSGRLGSRSAATINRHLDWFRHCLNAEAIPRGFLKTNPVQAIPKDRESPGRWKFLSHEEEQRLYVELEEPFRAWAEIGLLTGLRLSEQFSLTWSQFFPDQRLFRLYDTKAGEEQWALLTERALSLVESLRPLSQCEYIFVHPIRPHQPYSGKNFARWYFKQAVKRAGLKDVTWHTLRHTFASRLAMAGVNELARQSLGRWKDSRSVKRYSHLTQSHLHELLESVSNRDLNRDKRTKTKAHKNIKKENTPQKQRLTDRGEVAEWPKATVC